MVSSNLLREKFKKRGTLLPFLLPAIILALIFSYIPMIGLFMAFKTNLNLLIYTPFEAFGNAQWTLQNFQKILMNSEFLVVLRNTLFISALKIVVLFPLPIFYAILITEVGAKSGKFFQAIMYLPYFLSWVVTTGIFMNVFSAHGMVNNVLMKIGVIDEAYLWFQEPSSFIFLVLFTGGWKDIGYSMIVYISAILSINPTLYESAKIDGASKLRQVFKITLPLISGVIATMFILRICYIMDAGFDQIYTMLTTGNAKVAEIIGTYVYRLGIKEANYSFSTAVGLLNSVVALVLIVSGNFVVKKFTGKGIW